METSNCMHKLSQVQDDFLDAKQCKHKEEPEYCFIPGYFIVSGYVERRINEKRLVKAETEEEAKKLFIEEKGKLLEKWEEKYIRKVSNVSMIKEYLK